METGNSNFFKSIIEHLDEVLFVYNSNNPVEAEYITGGVENLCGRGRDEIIKVDYSEIIHEFDRNRYKKYFSALVNKNKEYSMEYRIIHENNVIKWIKESGLTIKDSSGNTSHYVRVLRDITAEKHSEGKYLNMAKVFMDAADPIIIEDLNGIVKDMNDEAVRIYGWTREELIGRPIKDIVPPERHEQADDLLLRCKQGEPVRNIEGLRWNKDKKIIPVLLTLSFLKDENDEPIAIATISKDITGVVEVRKLQKEIINISEMERQNFGQILHDELGQTLTGVSYLIEALKEKVEKNIDLNLSDVITIRDLMNRATTQVRNVSKGLSPVHMQEGLDISLEELAEETEKLFDVSCSVVIEGNSIFEDPVNETHLFYIAKESVHNAIKHGKAKNVEIFLYASDPDFILRVQNDGSGTENIDLQKEKGLGMQIMKYRAGIIDADFSIEGDDAGFVVTVRKKDFIENL